MRLLRHAFDCFILAEVSRQLVSIIKSFSIDNITYILFPLKPCQLSCKSLDEAMCLGSNLLKFNFGFYNARPDFDSKGIVPCLFNLKGKILPTHHIEDIQEDCEDELEGYGLVSKFGHDVMCVYESDYSCELQLATLEEMQSEG